MRWIFIRKLTFIVLLVILWASLAQAAWYDSNWQYRKSITIDPSKVLAEQTDFPVLVNLAADADLQNHAQLDGDDILFTSADGLTQLSHEIENYDGAAGNLVAWVKVPVLSGSASTVIYLYYGNGSIGPQEDGQNVWIAEYSGVWHLDEDQTGTGNNDVYLDSAFPFNPGSDHIAATGQEGKIGRGQQFSGDGDYISVPHHLSLNLTGPMTLSYWIKLSGDAGEWNRVIEKGNGGFTTAYYFGGGNGTNDVTYYLTDNEVFDTADNALTTENWHHVAVTYASNGDATFILNGTATPSGNYSGMIAGNTDSLYVSNPNPTWDSAGYLDEIRIAGADLGADWIITEYNNQSAPADFYSLGPEENLFQISGTVFEDANFAGTASNWDNGVNDLGLDNVDVELYDGLDTYVTSVTTAAGGAYTFTGLSNDTYKVRVRSATIGDADTPPAGGLNATVPGTWPYPLPEMAWGYGAALYGGQSATVDDANTGDNAGPGDTYVTVTVSGSDVTAVNFGLAYNLIVNTQDDGLGDNFRSDQGSLRQFLKNANAIGTAGGTTANTSQFHMQVATNQSSGADSWWRISPTSALSRLADGGAVLDASTQRINSGTNSNSLGPEIELNGASAGGTANGLRLTAGTSTVREMAIGSFGVDAIDISGGSAHLLIGNYLGIGANGLTDRGNNNDGIDIAGASSIVIGGIGANDRNVIAYNDNEGINFSGATTANNSVLGNYIGVAADGTTAAGNGDVGIAILSGSNGNMIGGPTVPERNIISMNFEGIEIRGANNTVQGNYIGTDRTGTQNLGHTSSDAVEITSSGANNTIEGNLIAFTKAGFHGVSVEGSTGNAVIRNEIHSNTGLGINLGASGVNPNDGAKTVGQPNLLMDFPIFTSATLSGTTLSVAGFVGSAPNQSTFADAVIEVFESDNDGTGYGEGRTYLGFLIADASGNFLGALDVTGQGLLVGEMVTGTATDASNNTSEFGANAAVTAPHEISGRVFEDADFAGTATNYDGGANDAALANVDVELYDATNAYLISTTTTGDGSYSFTGLAGGNYKVRVRSATIGDADTPPAGGLHPTVPGTWPHPLAEMTWGHGAAMIGGQDLTVDDTATADNAGPGDTWIAVTVSGADVTGVNLGFSYDLITNTDDDANADTVRSKQGCLRQFIKNSNAIVGVNKSWFQTATP